MHTDSRHLAANLLLFLGLSALLETKYGSVRLAAVWLAAVVGGGLLSAATEDPCQLVGGVGRGRLGGGHRAAGAAAGRLVHQDRNELRGYGRGCSRRADPDPAICRLRTATNHGVVCSTATALILKVQKPINRGWHPGPTGFTGLDSARTTAGDAPARGAPCTPAARPATCPADHTCMPRRDGRFPPPPCPPLPCRQVVGCSGGDFGLLGLFLADTLMGWGALRRPILRCALVAVLLGLLLATLAQQQVGWQILRGTENGRWCKGWWRGQWVGVRVGSLLGMLLGASACEGHWRKGKWFCLWQGKCSGGTVRLT